MIGHKISIIGMVVGFAVFIPLIFVGAFLEIDPLAVVGFVGVFASIFGSRIVGGLLDRVSSKKATARVLGALVSVSDTGRQVNRQPEMMLTIEFQNEAGETITGVMKKIIPLSQLVQLQPGAKVFIRYIPEQPHRIMLDDNPDD